MIRFLILFVFTIAAILFTSAEINDKYSFRAETSDCFEQNLPDFSADINLIDEKENEEDETDDNFLNLYTSQVFVSVSKDVPGLFMRKETGLHQRLIFLFTSLPPPLA